MAIGRVAGPMLLSELDRQGIDLHLQPTVISWLDWILQTSVWPYEAAVVALTYLT